MNPEGLKKLAPPGFFSRLRGEVCDCRRHPLHSDEFVESMNAMTPGGYAAHKNRQTGLTTAIALETIASAIRNPYKPIPIRDHFPTDMADRYLRSVIWKQINALGLREMHVIQHKGGLALQFGKP